MIRRGATMAAIATLALLAFGCPGDGTEIMDEMMGPTGPQPTLTWIQDNVFTPVCTQCHVPGGIGPMPLDSEDASFNNLVNVFSIEIPALLRVEPGNSANSYLIWKLDGRIGIVGSQMPLGGTPLDPETIAIVAEWIDNGAPR